MKTILRSILVILVEIAAIAAVIFGCIQLFPGADEVTVTQEELKAGEEGNIGANAGEALEESEESSDGEFDAEADADADLTETPAE